MGRGALGHRVAGWWGALILTAALTIMFPVAALATGGASDWPAPGGSSSWPGPAEDAHPETLLTPEMVAPEPIAVAPQELTTEATTIVAVEGIAFPVAGPSDYSASFGAPRPDERTHEGIDIFAEKMTPVVAAADGTVGLMRNGIGTDCCVVKIYHDDGRASLYLHLNNDTPGTDDGLGYGLAEGIAVGVRVQAGTVIGYVGDSGNAEETPPHLHFELHTAGGMAVDPYPYLQIAQGAEPALFAAALAAQPETLPATGGPFGTLAVLSVALLSFGASLTGDHRRR